MQIITERESTKVRQKISNREIVHCTSFTTTCQQQLYNEFDACTINKY